MAKSRPAIVFTANLWTLEGHPSPRREWSLARKVRAVADAGFDAVTARASAELAALLRTHGLRFMGFFATSVTKDLKSLLAAQKAAGAETVNVQLGDDFTLTPEALRLTRALLAEARRQEVYAAVEVHRDTATETPEKTYALADAYRIATKEVLPLTWDHSHLAVVKHVNPFLFSEVLLQRKDLIQAARLFHLRPFNGQHAQIPVMDARGRLTPEFLDWLKFAEDLFRMWLAGPQPGGEIWVCPEVGPTAEHGYNLSVMEPSWEQAIVCRRELLKVWKRVNRSPRIVGRG
jgi:hypothetical protein